MQLLIGVLIVHPQIEQLLGNALCRFTYTHVVIWNEGTNYVGMRSAVSRNRDRPSTVNIANNYVDSHYSPKDACLDNIESFFIITLQFAVLLSNDG